MLSANFPTIIYKCTPSFGNPKITRFVFVISTMKIMSRYESRHGMSEMTETETEMSGGSVKMAPVLEI